MPMAICLLNNDKKNILLNECYLSLPNIRTNKYIIFIVKK